MHYYKTTLRLGGSTLNEVVKIVSAPEFLILQFIHGSDACTKVEEIKNEKIVLFAEKERLKILYESGLNRKDQSVDSIFGALGTLPERLPPHLIEQFNLGEDGLELYDPKEVAKKGKQTSDSRNQMTQTQVDNLNNVVSAEEVNVADLMG